MIEYAFILVFLAIILVAVLPPIADAVQGFLGSVDFGLGPRDAGANEAA
jgi:Flp pilus assembly pilin Flp